MTYILAAVCFILQFGVSISQGQGFTTFAAANDLLRQTVLEEVDSEVQEGSSAGQVVIERVVAYPASGNTDEITLRNIGGQTVDLFGWYLTDNKNTNDRYIFGGSGCEEQAMLKPGFAVILYPYSLEQPCGFEFSISFKDSVNLFNDKGALVGQVSWNSTQRGIAFYRTEEGQYLEIPEGTKTVIDVLSGIPDFSHFLLGLKLNGLYNQLRAPSDPENLEPFVPQPPEPNYYEIIEFPWWFGYARDKSEYPTPAPAPLPPPFVPGVPELGPYTLLAPTNKAFEDARRLITGSNRTRMSQFLTFPGLNMDIILKYHILGGGYSSAFMFDNVPINTTQGQDVLIVRDPQEVEGTIAIMDQCVDKPTGGFTCEQQKDFGKCLEPFMLSSLSAQWQGGFCERTCERCSCRGDTHHNCAKVEFADIMATNGVIHTISRLLFPAPVFEFQEAPPTQEMTDKEAEDMIQNMQNNIGSLPRLPSLPGLPKGLRG
eukprot:TRINITY_DN995_c0_g1_i17.p1 TRINITY_DN995_c0_g1~~TRINITY_DN995_c0_g1_i17.p1  ORF type:complete len:486 (-),score=73.46 TRINITY_DN995_c0_g1_i17:277-1734(-)